jgi:hypothetical protein
MRFIYTCFVSGLTSDDGLSDHADDFSDPSSSPQPCTSHDGRAVEQLVEVCNNHKFNHLLSHTIELGNSRAESIQIDSLEGNNKILIRSHAN